MTDNLTNVSVMMVNQTDQTSPVTYTMQLVFGSAMLVFGLIGVVGNVVALYAFCSSRRLRRPKNYVVANLCLTDMLMCVVYCPVIVISSFNNSVPSDAACKMEGFVVGTASIATICNLVAIAVERYFSIAQPMKSLTILTRRRFLGAVAAVWVYSLLMVFPPLVGWGRFVREETKISCSFDYLSQDDATKSYVSFLVIGAFGAPLLVIGYCYIRVFTTVRKHAQKRKLMSPLKKSSSEIKTAVNAFVITAAFCLCWCPYAAVAVLGISGVSTQAPVVFSVALLAKLSVLINPVVYVFSIPSFQEALWGHNWRRSRSSETPMDSSLDRVIKKRRKKSVDRSTNSYRESVRRNSIYSTQYRTCLLSPAAAKRLAGGTKSIVDIVTELELSDFTANRESWV